VLITRCQEPSSIENSGKCQRFEPLSCSSGYDMESTAFVGMKIPRETRISGVCGMILRMSLLVI
jgi:hypothetical protein